MHILIAPNAFKNSLDAAKVAEAVNNGLHQSKLSCTTTCFPVADGGDGTAGLLIDHLCGQLIHAIVQDPLARKITSSFGWIEKDKTTIIELSAASGLRLLKTDEYDPLVTTTQGTGELIIEALNKGAAKIILCIGGSATVDGGIGILKALGMKFFDAGGNELNNLPASLSSLAEIDMTGLDKRIANTEIIILCDVENPLLGSHGAAAIFGPQKGASGKDVQLIETGLTKLRDVVLNKTGKDMAVVKHGGAAGGVAAALHILLNADLVNGIDYFLQVTGFEKELLIANLVITGEGCIDEQTLRGKGPFGVAKRAKEFSLPVIGIAGRVPGIIDKSMQHYFDRLISINENIDDLEAAIKNTYTNLEKTAKDLGDMLFLSLVQN
ncbi:MAG TPA: glycerate kinase [Chitinophagaceae bacterium]|nr:glycerate kinase [Chitinophagaceae bacterium]